MKRDREDDEQGDDQSEPPLKQTHTILEDLHKNLVSTVDIDQQLLNTQKEYFTQYLEKLLEKIPMGKTVIETVRKNDQSGDFLYIYTASKAVVQSILNVKQMKATKSIIDMISSVCCRYVHQKIISPMLANVVNNERLKRAYSAYQVSVKSESDEAELEMQCLLHTINQLIEQEEGVIKSIHPIKVQMTQQMKAISEYVVELLMSVSQPEPETPSEV